MNDEFDDLDDLLGPEPEIMKKVKKPKIGTGIGSVEEKRKQRTVDEANKPSPIFRANLKGQMVTFKNKKGETIIGHGTLYWVVNMNGKLHYKRESEVTVLPDL